MTLPFDSAISAFYENTAPPSIREAVAGASKKQMVTPSYPHARRLGRNAYETDLLALQIELVKLQHWVRESGARIAIIFEGRDTAGKGGTINAFTQHLNPRNARIIALPKPTEVEATQWYFQRYIDHLPAGGDMVFFDRSWYNRGVVEKVFGFCTDAQREHFFQQVNDVERMLVDEGIHLVKLWLNVGRAEQLRRLLSRENDPLKQWKLSWIDVKGLEKWDAYTDAIRETLQRSNSAHAPWTILRSDDKRRARLSAIRTVLGGISYDRKDPDAIGTPDPQICGGLEVWDG